MLEISAGLSLGSSPSILGSVGGDAEDAGKIGTNCFGGAVEVKSRDFEL